MTGPAIVLINTDTVAHIRSPTVANVVSSAISTCADAFGARKAFLGKAAEHHVAALAALKTESSRLSFLLSRFNISSSCFVGAIGVSCEVQWRIESRRADENPTVVVLWRLSAQHQQLICVARFTIISQFSVNR